MVDADGILDLTEIKEICTQLNDQRLAMKNLCATTLKNSTTDSDRERDRIQVVGGTLKNLKAFDPADCRFTDATELETTLNNAFSFNRTEPTTVEQQAFLTEMTTNVFPRLEFELLQVQLRGSSVSAVFPGKFKAGMNNLRQLNNPPIDFTNPTDIRYLLINAFTGTDHVPPSEGQQASLNEFANNFVSGVPTDTVRRAALTQALAKQCQEAKTMIQNADLAGRLEAINKSNQGAIQSEISSIEQKCEKSVEPLVMIQKMYRHLPLGSPDNPRVKYRAALRNLLPGISDAQYTDTLSQLNTLLGLLKAADRTLIDQGGQNEFRMLVEFLGSAEADTMINHVKRLIPSANKVTVFRDNDGKFRDTDGQDIPIDTENGLLADIAIITELGDFFGAHVCIPEQQPLPFSEHEWYFTSGSGKQVESYKDADQTDVTKINQNVGTRYRSESLLS